MNKRLWVVAGSLFVSVIVFAGLFLFGGQVQADTAVADAAIVDVAAPVSMELISADSAEPASVAGPPPPPEPQTFQITNPDSDGDSWRPAISANGHFIAFATDSTNQPAHLPPT